MPRVHVEASATVDAKPEVVYGILSDYNNGHPRILPDENFSNLRVEQGGVGEGTVISFVSKVGGAARNFRMRIEEPEPGRILIERDLASDTVTTFTVSPVGDGHSLVKIATDWSASPGISGLVEKIVAPAMLRKVYEAELRKLEVVATSQVGREG